MKRFPALIFIMLLLVYEMTVSPVLSKSFSPTLLTLKCDQYISYNFNGSALDIPVMVEGTPAGVIFCLFTKDRPERTLPATNGYLGWHYVNKVDTCIYHSALYSFDPGPHTITWDGRDQDGRHVRPDDYTYYLWGYDNKSEKQLMTKAMYSGGNFDMTSAVQETDESGLPLANPIWYRADSHWSIGYDPMDETLKCTTDLSGAIAEGWTVLGNPQFDARDFSWQYVMVADKKNRRGSLQRIRFIPYGMAEADSTWGSNGFADMFETAGGGSAGIASDGDYLFTIDDNLKSTNWPDADFYIYDYDGHMVDHLDLTPWWSDHDSYYAGAQMNGGPDNFYVRDDHVFLNGHASCLVQMVNPKRYLESGVYDDFFVWSNGNGDYVLDKNFEETATFRWVCNDYTSGPFMHSIAADRHHFTVSNVTGIEAITFGLLAPDGTGIGSYRFAGEQVEPHYGVTCIDAGTPYDGLYCDYPYTFMINGVLYERMELGIAFIAHDSIKGMLTMMADCFGDDGIVAITAPNGGESLVAGATAVITWTVAGRCYLPDYLWIEQSVDDGITWSTVNNNAKTTDLSVAWTVPAVESQTCRIRLRNAITGYLVDNSDASFAIVRGNTVDEAKPALFSLSQNVPNPFNPVTFVSFSLPDERRATLVVYTAAGTKAATLADGVFSAGSHEITWDASAFPSGIYLCRLKAGSFEKTVKMALVK